MSDSNDLDYYYNSNIDSINNDTRNSNNDNGNDGNDDRI